MPLGKRTDYGDAKFAGVQVDFAAAIEPVVQDLLLCGFDFIIAPLVRPGYQLPPRGTQQDGQLPLPYLYGDVCYLPSSQWSSQVVGHVSGWIDPDSADPSLRLDSVQAITQELAWAGHLGLQAVVLPPPPQPLHSAAYAQAISEALAGLTHMALWLTIPLGPSHIKVVDSQATACLASAAGPPPVSGRTYTSTIDTPCAATTGAASSTAAQHATGALPALSSAAAPSTPPVAESNPQAPVSEGTMAVAARPMAAASATSRAPRQPTKSTAPAPAAGSDAYEPWEAWHRVRSLCDYDPLLGCVLQLCSVLPPPPLLQRWLGEPVKAVVVPTHVFGANKRGYPTLPKGHQELLALLFKHSVQVVVSGPPLHAVPQGTFPPLPSAAGPGGTAGAGSSACSAAANVTITPGTKSAKDNGVGDDIFPFVIENPGESHPLRQYWEYLCYLFRKLETLGEQDKLEGSYRDYLQAPLQPLQDNLESSTYEVFEKDVTKYEVYGEAVYRALLDRVPDSEASSTTTVLMVVGAGRGPLVRASMQAAARAGRLVCVYAVEKNPNAIVHIQAMLHKEGWQEQVTIVSADMRHWAAPELAHILVSELLGSFGDNELSPECLDGAQRFLAPAGVSIPASYTSYLAPIASHKLYNEVKAYKDLEHVETPYVVKLHRMHLLSPAQPVFTFVHPNQESPIDNRRFGRLRFERSPACGAGILHGFAGYFEAVLYDGSTSRHKFDSVLLSTHVPTHTPNMFSWFPIFFPLANPIELKAGEAVEVAMWRCVASHKVWYEWAATAPAPSRVHNVQGRSYYVGL